MLVRRESFGGESRRESLSRRLEQVAGIRRGDYSRRPAPYRRPEPARFTIDRGPDGRRAA
jgi:hypothetical protein